MTTFCREMIVFRSQSNLQLELLQCPTKKSRHLQYGSNAVTVIFEKIRSKKPSKYCKGFTTLVSWEPQEEEEVPSISRLLPTNYSLKHSYVSELRGRLTLRHYLRSGCHVNRCAMKIISMIGTFLFTAAIGKYVVEDHIQF